MDYKPPNDEALEGKCLLKQGAFQFLEGEKRYCVINSIECPCIDLNRVLLTLPDEQGREKVYFGCNLNKKY